MAIPLKADATRRQADDTRGRRQSRYREFMPSNPAAALATACTWEGWAGWARDFRLLPDGCVDVVWNGATLMACTAAPVAQRAHLWADSRNVGLRLTCGTADAILGMPMDHLPAGAIRLRETWGTLAVQGEVLLAQVSTPADQRAVLEGLVVARLNDGHRPDATIVDAVRRLAVPATTVAMAADASGLATRELHRRFHRSIGYGPKALQRVQRFGRFIRRIAVVADGSATLASLAADLGYADQAHLGRECRQIAGSSPGALVRSWRQ